MKFYKSGLLTMLISLFILSSCKRQEGIGLDVDPATQLNGTLVVDTSIVATTVPEDSVITSGSTGRLPLSYFQDPEFGVSESDISTQLSLPGSVAYTVPTGTVTIDSAKLILPYAADGFYGDSLLSTFTVDVHRLSENITTSKPYYSNQQIAFLPEVIGTKTFKARVHDSLYIINIVKGGKDTLAKVPPQVRITLNKEFINEFLFSAPASVLKSNAAYQNFVKGLHLTVNKSQTSGVGGNMFFNLDSSRVQIYYKVTSSGAVDTTSIAMPLVNGNAQIKHTYSAQVQAALNQTSTDGKIYLQGMAGLRAKLSLPDPKSILAAVGNNAVINKAELIIKVAPGTATPFMPNQQLTLYRYDLAKQRILLQDASATDPRASGGFGGNYVSSAGEYHFLVTAYIQDLISGKSIDYGTYLAPVAPPKAASTVIDINPTAIYGRRSIVVGKNSPNRIKLNIIYTKLNK